MMRFKQIFSQVVASFFIVWTISGCAALQETMASQMEVPTLENQANRVAIGMAIVRENAIMENLEISSDAAWPAMVCAQIDEKQKEFIERAVMYDAYYATAHYTKAIQRRMLGSGSLMNEFGDVGNLAAMAMDQSISPLSYKAFHKIDVLFSNPDLKSQSAYRSQEEYFRERTKNWPNIFSFKSVGSFLEFNNAKPVRIESPQGDIYKNINTAMLALAPVSLAKDLEISQNEYDTSLEEVEALKMQLGDLTSQLESSKANASIKSEIALKEEEIKSAESIANEKERIYFTQLDRMVVEIENSVDTKDEDYKKLAHNINIVAKEIQSSSYEAYLTFSVALTNITVNKSLQNFPNELKSLLIGKVFIPPYLQSKYNERVARIVENSLLVLPNVFVGSYYAAKQSSRAAKFEAITDKILEIYDVKAKQDYAQKQTNK